MPKPKKLNHNLFKNTLLRLHHSPLLVHVCELSLAVAFVVLAGVGLQTTQVSKHASAPNQNHTPAARQASSLKASEVAKTPVAPATVPVPTTPAPAPAATPTPVAAKPASVAVSAGTPKAEPVVTPAPNSSVSSLTPTTSTTPPATAGSGSTGSSGSATSTGSSPSSTTVTGYTSTNWSGYIAANAIFTTVSGAWAATSPTANGSGTSADGTWIGIGGVTASDLIQVGTENNFSAGGNESTAAFYEILPATSQTITSITVAPDDNMTASITETSNGQWNIVITDLTNGQSATIAVAYTSSQSSAEWIEEDPSYSSRRQIPFDNFGSVSFSNATTTANGTLLNLSTSTAQPVTMVNHSGQVTAMPSAVGSDGASFTLTP